jgi:hypothetical protein
MTGIKLEVGKRYVRRDGCLTGPLAQSVYADWPFIDPHAGYRYRYDGSQAFDPSMQSRADLIAIAPDEAPEAQPETTDDLVLERVIVELSRSADKLGGMGYHGDAKTYHAGVDMLRELPALRARVAEKATEISKMEREINYQIDRANKAEAENARLREALEKIANYEESMMRWRDIARTALTAKDPAR